MGYNTEFKGELKFVKPLTGPQLAELNRYINGTAIMIDNGSYYSDLVLLDDFSGLRWNDETEKTYKLVEIINWLIDKFDFLELEGELLAQGEDHEDRWKLAIKNGKAIRIDYPRTGMKITCPICDGEFVLEDQS